MERITLLLKKKIQESYHMLKVRHGEKLRIIDKLGLLGNKEIKCQDSVKEAKKD